MLRKNVDMAVSFGKLAGQAGTAPGSNVPGSVADPDPEPDPVV